MWFELRGCPGTSGGQIEIGRNYPMGMDYRLLSADGCPAAIRSDLLLSGRLKRHGVEAKIIGAPRGRICLRGVDGCLVTNDDATGLCAEFWHNNSQPEAPWSVVDALEKEFELEVLFEEDPRFWGLANEEELFAGIVVQPWH
jgi:hypothetical protein